MRVLEIAFYRLANQTNTLKEFKNGGCYDANDFNYLTSGAITAINFKKNFIVILPDSNF